MHVDNLHGRGLELAELGDGPVPASASGSGGAGTAGWAGGAIPAVAPTGHGGAAAASASEQAFGASPPAPAPQPAGARGAGPAPETAATQRVVAGVTISAPAGTHPEAIDRCAEIVNLELGRNAYAQHKLARARATIVIIPAATRMVDLPQFAGLRRQHTFDGRDWSTVRGSGGRRAPDGSFAIGVAEENLIAIPGVTSGYPAGYSIGMHELAHALESHGMTDRQHDRLRELYRAHARRDPGDRNDTFTDVYAASNLEEYFAQATNAFFGKNDSRDASARPYHNGRAWLAAHDPEMYAFLVELYERDHDERGRVAT